MKYGLMIFNKTRNIGDDIQSYVSMKYIPRIDYFIDRENLDSFIPRENEKVAVIMNGWYIHYTLNWPPSPYIKPLPVAMHFTTRDFWDIKNEGPHICGYGAEYLKSIAPIGCRDTHTLKLLSGKNIPTEFTGCLTLTLEKFADVERQEYVCAVDVSANVLEKIKATTDLEVKEITHFMHEDYYKLSWDERVKKVEELLKVYQGAKCVITTRLHCGLPCTALNTPVLIIHNKYHDDRFKDYLEYIDFCFEPDFLDGTYNYDFSNPPPNKTEYIKIRDDLNKRCTDFIKECENYDTNKTNDILPDKDFYSNYVISKSNWYKEIALKLENKVRLFEQTNLIDKLEIEQKDSIIDDLENEVNELNTKLEKLDTNFNELKIESSDVNYRLDHIQNSRCWKACKVLYKVRDGLFNKK